jgi:hypothetical protein
MIYFELVHYDRPLVIKLCVEARFSQGYWYLIGKVIFYWKHTLKRTLFNKKTSLSVPVLVLIKAIIL